MMCIRFIFVFYPAVHEEGLAFVERETKCITCNE